MVINKHSNPDLMQVFILAEGQRFPDQIGTSLTQGVIEALNMRGFSRLFAHRMMALGGQHRPITLQLIRIQHSPFPIIGRQGLPQGVTSLFRTIPKGQPDDVASATF